jgi:hypothetical protein
MARAAGTDKREVLAVINGDYFDEQRGRGPWGIHLEDGQLVFSPIQQKSTFFIMDDGTALIQIPKLKVTATLVGANRTIEIKDVNRYDRSEKPGVHLYSRQSERNPISFRKGSAIVMTGKSLAVNKSIRCKVTEVFDKDSNITIPEDGYVLISTGGGEGLSAKPGAQIILKTDLYPAAQEGVGGGPRLLFTGNKNVSFDREDFSPAHAAVLKAGRNPRSAVGVSEDHRYAYLVVAEGRIERSIGMTIEELNRLMSNIGAFDAMEFDGGGSSTLYTIKGVSQAEGTELRNVANGLAVYKVEDTGVENTAPDEDSPDRIDLNETQPDEAAE